MFNLRLGYNRDAFQVYMQYNLGYMVTFSGLRRHTLDQGTWV